MKYKVVAIRDRAVDGFMRPWFVTHIGAAARTFADEINRQAPDNALCQHPEDYDLYELGDYDDATGLFQTGVPRQVSVGKDVVRQK